MTTGGADTLVASYAGHEINLFETRAELEAARTDWYANGFRVTIHFVGEGGFLTVRSADGKQAYVVGRKATA